MINILKKEAKIIVILQEEGIEVTRCVIVPEPNMHLHFLTEELINKETDEITRTGRICVFINNFIPSAKDIQFWVDSTTASERASNAHRN